MTDFTYSDADKSLSYTLDKGRHNLSFVLVDEGKSLYSTGSIFHSSRTSLLSVV